MPKKTEPVKIFGYEWEDIDAMQRGTYKPRPINLTKSGRPEATQSDKDLLEEHGVDGLKKKGLFGVLDRLQGSGLLDNPKLPRYRVALVRETSINVQYPHQVTNHDKIVYAFRQLFSELDREQIAAATLDSKNRIIGLNVVHMGSLSASVAHPREIMKLAVLQNAAAVVVAHNHPSGDPQPSAEDRQGHTRLEAAANGLGIKYLDNLVIGEDFYYAFSDGLVHSYSKQMEALLQ